MGKDPTGVRGVVNRQFAFVRALADEIDRYPPLDFRAEALREQLREETARLAELLDQSSAAAVA